MSGGFPIDLVLFGLVAAFLVLRLRSILGRRTGFERPAQPQPQPGAAPRPGAPVIDGRAEPPPPPARPLPDPASPAGQGLAQMQALDRGFDPIRFLDGAEQAFRLIVTAFAAGDRVALRPLLTDDTYRGFEAAISARETEGQTQRSEIRAVLQAGVEQAELRGHMADITVRFVTEQVSLTLGRDGLPVAGADALTEMVDEWTFERELLTTDPAWRLAAARSA